MRIIVHYPEDKDVLGELQKKASIIHSQAVLRYLQQLSCPDYQKQELLESMIAAKKGRDGSHKHP